MHDLLEAQKILETILDYAKQNKLKRVKSVEIELGRIIDHGEVLKPENMKFNLETLSRGTIAEGFAIMIKSIDGDCWKLKIIEGEQF